jgi:predicted PhzF superfamily epimerase YddE/YHI9
VLFETRRSGPLNVSKDGAMLVMDFPAMSAKACPNPPEPLLRALGTEPRPVAVWEANETYIASYQNQAAIEAFCPDFDAIEQLHPFVLSVTAPGDEADFVSRYFAPSYGIPEDPVTGSVHCILTPYWAEKLGKKNLYAQQISNRGGELWCTRAKNRVLIKGNAILTLQGSLQI